MIATHPCHALLDGLQQVIIGKAPTLRLVVAAMLADGHVLLEDVPGVGKTLLARTLARLVGGSSKRVQFSPDLMPSDVTGGNMFMPASGSFHFLPGPIFAHVLLADEINRASPRTQASLLEAMEEGRVTVDGESHALPSPFMVIATQNPVEHHGTFPLPEAQLDRFAIAVSLGYPNGAEEQRLLARAVGADVAPEPTPVVSPEQVAAWQRDVRGVSVEESLQAYMVAVAQRTRQHPEVALGVSPRGNLLWLRVAQALAFLDGRTFVTPDDLHEAAGPVLAHRLLLAGRSGSAARRELVRAVLAEVPVPD